MLTPPRTAPPRPPQGKVKQIVGSTLVDLPASSGAPTTSSSTHSGTAAASNSGAAPALKTNFVSDKPSSWYAQLYQRDGLTGGHVIMLGADDESRWPARAGGGSGRGGE